MKIATWNVNSVRARLERLLAWLQKTEPDIVCLQELKAREEAFPYEAIREALEELLDWGLVDVVREQHPEGGLYSWWDYRNLAFPKNDGLRLDYIFDTRSLACRCTAADVAEIKTIFEPWQLAQYLETARETEPFDPSLFEPRSHPLFGEEKIELDAEEIEDMRKDDIRQCTRDLLLVERAREWLLEKDEAAS
ncbi:MAG: endonuclease/exonuclease/phosphatase family protein [Thermoguttaceae bacterium]|jgi:hypothetical protein|nr:endonuclease/exonuclease/phosphatase family protein [Thermoguttaceae bacterium]